MALTQPAEPPEVKQNDNSSIFSALPTAAPTNLVLLCYRRMPSPSQHIPLWHPKRFPPNQQRFPLLQKNPKPKFGHPNRQNSTFQSKCCTVNRSMFVLLQKATDSPAATHCPTNANVNKHGNAFPLPLRKNKGRVSPQNLRDMRSVNTQLPSPRKGKAGPHPRRRKPKPPQR